MKKAIILLAMLCVVACDDRQAKESPTQVNIFTDPSDGYKCVQIGKQIWMAENLNYAANGSKCYDNNYDNCEKYGRLYNWNDAMEACPKGWHLPSVEEWETLLNFTNGYRFAGKKLKAKNGWGNIGNGTDEFGFSALPGGNGSSDGSFYDVGHYGTWWSATEYNASNAYYRLMYYDYNNVRRGNSNKSSLFSVRCLKDKAKESPAPANTFTDTRDGKKTAAELISSYNEAIRLNPNNAEAYFRRGFEYSKKGDSDRAISDFNETIRLNPNNAEAYYNRGSAYDRKGDYDRAISDYNEAIRLNPNNAYAYSWRGNAYEAKGDYNKAIADYESALRIDPNHSYARENLKRMKQ